LPREVFVAGQVLTAAELNVVSDQSVMVFAGTAARGSAIPSPSEGMVTYREDDDLVEVYNGSAFVPIAQEPVAPAILQVVSVNMPGVFSSTAGSPTPITGLAATITPSSTSSKVFVVVNLGRVDGSTATGIAFQLKRDSTVIGGGTVVGSRLSTFMSLSSSPGIDAARAPSANFLDSPSTTSAVTYSVEGYNDVAGSRTFYINRSHTDGNSATATNSRASSNITLMEVAG
jgi:hypothetical protein